MKFTKSDKRDTQMRALSKMAIAAGAVSASLAAASPVAAFECTDGSVKLGLARAVPGGFSFFDISGANGVRIAVEEINGAGGIEGCPLEVLSGDTQSNPALSGQIAEELIDVLKHGCG